jgi:DNA-binding NtrC family response regulator
MNDAEPNPGGSILVIDDEINELKALIIGMRLEGFEVLGVSTCTEAMDALDRRSFDAALIDLMMPEMNGLQLARAIREAHPEVRTILMSAYHLSPIQLARAETGAVGFVPKPFRFDELVGFLRTKIGAGTSAAAVFAARPSTDASGLHRPFDVPDSAC